MSSVRKGALREGRLGEGGTGWGRKTPSKAIGYFWVGEGGVQPFEPQHWLVAYSVGQAAMSPWRYVGGCPSWLGEDRDIRAVDGGHGEDGGSLAVAGEAESLCSSCLSS